MIAYRTPASALKAPNLEPPMPFLAETLALAASCQILDLMRRSTTAVSPISRLPIELLSEIFLCCVDLDIRGHKQPGFIPSLAMINQVNVLWRSVAISMPQLWSGIMIYGPTPRHVPMTSLFLSRSQSYPLSINLVHTHEPVGKDSYNPEVHVITDTLLTLLLAHLCRWRSIKFAFLGETQQTLLSLPQDPSAAPLLETVVLGLRSWDTHSADRLWKSIHSYSSVRQIAWRGYVPAFPGHVPWAQLTDVCIDFQDITTCLDVLKECQSLKTLNASFYYDQPHTPLSFPDVTLDSLESLQIYTQIELGSLFDHLTLPSLKSLSINRANGSPADAKSLISLLKRSNCHIESFSFATTSDDSEEEDEDEQDELMTYLTAPQLSYLLYLEVNLVGRTQKQNVVDLLTHQASRKLLPDLIGITVIVVDEETDEETDENDEGLLAMFASRIDYSPGQYREFDICKF